MKNSPSGAPSGGEVEDPAAFARTAFIEALEGAGVEVSATATGSNPSDLLPSQGSYGESERVAEHVSAPLEEFTSVMLKTSHNAGADLMACLIAVEAGSRDCKDGFAQEFEVPPVSEFLQTAYSSSTAPAGSSLVARRPMR